MLTERPRKPAYNWAVHAGKGLRGNMVRVGTVLPLNRYSLIIAVAIVLAAAVFFDRYLAQASAPSSNSRSAELIRSSPIQPLKSSIDSQSQTDSSGSESNTSSSSVTVNGQSIPVPQNGSYSQTTQSDGSTTTVNVQNSSSSTATASGNDNHSSLRVRVDSHSDSQESQ